MLLHRNRMRNIKSQAKAIRDLRIRCIKEHQQCRNSWKLVSPKRRLLTRLLDVGAKRESQTLRVVECKTISRRTEYLTLSHCWGSRRYLTLTTENLQEYTRSIPVAQLPCTFQDAIELTRQLGQRYIWIDSLCILQDSKEDWLKESALMGTVYSQSLLNIAATASSDGDGGLFHYDTTLSANACMVPIPGSSLLPSKWRLIHLSPEIMWDNMVENAPLEKESGWSRKESYPPEFYTSLPRAFYGSAARGRPLMLCHRRLGCKSTTLRSKLSTPWTLSE